MNYELVRYPTVIARHAFRGFRFQLAVSRFRFTPEEHL